MIIQFLCFFLFLFLLSQVTMFRRSFKNFVDQELGSFPHFLIYTVLEWTLITILFIDGLLVFLSNQYARFFDLNTPCLLCTRIDHVLFPRDPHFYYNDSICDSHKKKVSSLAYCHVHKKLSEIQHMCGGCLLSFATKKESACDTYKSLIGILHKQLPLALKEDDNFVQTTTNLIDYKKNNNNKSLKQHCSCCGELLKNNSSFFAPAPSPRVPYNKLSENESEFRVLDVDRTLSVVRGGNKFFETPLRKIPLDKTENTFDMADSNGEYILNQLKKEARLDKKSLIDLYMELDEERSASAVAANNAMAMITRLQAEKAAVQMEALQCQRMMDEQAEYDQEALQSMSSILAKKEDEIKELEDELDAYREAYGCLKDEDDVGEEFLEQHGSASADDDCQETKPVLNVAFCSSNHEVSGENIEQSESFKSEESGFLGQMKGTESKEGIVKELSEITERLSALQSNGELLKHIGDVLDVSEGEAILLQISQNLHMLRSFVAMPSES